MRAARTLAIAAALAALGCNFDQAFLEDCVERGACRLEGESYCTVYRNWCGTGIPCCDALVCSASQQCVRPAEPLLKLDAPTLDLGTLLKGDVPQTRTAVLTNTGGGPTTALRTLTGGNDGAFRFDVTACEGRELAPGESCTIGVTPNPPANSVGAFAATLTLREVAEFESLRAAYAYDVWHLSLFVGTSGLTNPVTLSPSLLDCSYGECGRYVQNGTTLTIQRIDPPSGYYFQGFAGCDPVDDHTCTVTMNSARFVSAPFFHNLRLWVNAAPQARPQLGYPAPPKASVVVIARDDGTSRECAPGYCALPEVGTVTLYAMPSGAEVFEGWAGACTGTASCTLTLPAAVHATFTPKR